MNQPRDLITRVPVYRGLLPLADVPDGECRDGRPEQVIRRKHSVIPMPVLARRRLKIGQPVQKLKRRELDAAAGPWPCGLSRAAGANLVGRLMSRQHVADASDLAVCTAAHGEPLEREGWPGAIPQQVLQTLKVARQEALEYIEDDEVVEVTPDAIRLRKILLSEHQRRKEARSAKG